MLFTYVEASVSSLKRNFLESGAVAIDGMGSVVPGPVVSNGVYTV